MKKNLHEIVTASVCKFTTGVDIDGRLVPKISTESCDEPCGFCLMLADYLCQQIKELADVIEQPTEGLH